MDTCNDQWHWMNGASHVNMDTGSCNVVKNSIRMNTIKKNLTGHWCKVYLAKQRCRRKNYRFMIFRDDDTKINVNKVLKEARKSSSQFLVSYKARNKRVMSKGDY